MTGTLCPWTDTCVPDRPELVVVAAVGLVIVVTLAVNDYIGGRKDKEK